MNSVCVAFLTLVTVAACESTTGVVGATGSWVGSVPVNGATWTVSVTLTQAGDSLKGSGNVNAQFFHEAYFVTGTALGDSVTIGMRPVEDADIHIAGRLAVDRITGRFWFNADTASAVDIALERQ